MNQDKKELREEETNERIENKQKANSNRKSHLQRNCSDEALKNGKKQPGRRRKGSSKPRRIQQGEPKLGGRKENSLESVLERVLKAKQSINKDCSGQNATEKSSKMIEIHETLPMHPHMSKTVPSSSSPPGSVESPNSVYSNERSEEPMNETAPTSRVEPFVKVRPQSSGDLSPELASTHEELQRSFSSDAALRKPSVSPIHRFVKDAHDLVDAGRPSPPSLSPNNSNALAAMAAMGLPTMIQSNGMIPSSIPSLIAMQQYRRESFQDEEKKRLDLSPKDRRDNYSSSGRGVPSLPNGVSLNPSNVSPPPSADVRAQYKRPPHTYPALIASAILDSPGHLITLRGIYDYIMNNFPYYKYCHDKSAWQNSIRHNLSLNQCFVKVPRYENAAKSNYWTMTPEGFEEFGNENSFKRRRRRGASLAPISAYKAKKCQNEGTRNGKSKTEPRTPPAGIGSIANPAVGINVGGFSPHIMSLAAWGPSLRGEEVSTKSRKRSHSPSGNDAIKHPRMVVLKQGDGPALDGIKTDDQKRPNSLSSVEEMQGTLNYFSKNLLDSQCLSKSSGKMDPRILTSTAQPWIVAAQKIAPPLSERAPKSPNKSASENGLGDDEIVTSEGIEIGKAVMHGRGGNEVPVRQYQCRFCVYAYIGASSFVLEQHARIMHPYELNNLKGKSHDKVPESPKEPDQMMSLPSMLPGLTSRSMLTAAQSSAQNLLAVAQASAVGNSAPGFPYSASFSSALLNDSVMRSIAEQVNASQAKVVSSDLSPGVNNVEAYVQRQQAFNNALQHAAAASTSQEQVRFLYQQLAMNNPFLANSGAMFPRQIPTSDAESNPFAQQLWQQYQQKFLNQMKAFTDKNGENISSPLRRNSNPDNAIVSNHIECATTPQKSPQSIPDANADSKKSIHGWKQCVECDFTAKGEHGLELHLRKAHVQTDATVTSSNEDVTCEASAAEDKMPILKSELSKAKISGSEHVTSPSSLTALVSITSPKRSGAPLDLSGVRDEPESFIPKSGAVSSASTQTVAPLTSGSAENRTCRFCDITFGDEMMHALHMSCHDKTDPFKCTICGQSCNEKFYFNVHLLRGLHQQQEGRTAVSRQTSLEASKSEGEASPYRHNSDNDSALERSRANSASNEVVY